MVCLFLYGGNDSFNTVLATDPDSFANYTLVRNQSPSSIALLEPGVAPRRNQSIDNVARLGGVLPITVSNPQERQFALHPMLGQLQNKFNLERRLAVVANVGSLIQPLVKADLNNPQVPKPPRLYSHNDQQNWWMSLATEGVTQGWGGRVADQMEAAQNHSAFTAISTSGNTVFLFGRNVVQYRLTASGAVSLGKDNNGQIYGSTVLGEAVQQIAKANRGSSLFGADLAMMASRSIDTEQRLRAQLISPSDPLVGTPAANYNPSQDPKLMFMNPATNAMQFSNLMHQLQMVARLVHAGPALGLRRQVFFVSLGGFDTHNFQNRNHAVLMAQLDQAMAYFDTTLQAVRMGNAVTTFTMSDFGRTFTSNGDGTDHGWGSHQFVMGGAVRGGDIYGRFPVLAARNSNNSSFDASADLLNRGVLLPSISVDQYAATLASWLGADSSTLNTALPYLANFSVKNLGFLA